MVPKILAKLKLESISPISLGGYDTKMCRSLNSVMIEEPFRLSSLKGTWRWWMRAYVAGAAYDNGLVEKEQAIKIVDGLLGSTEVASKFGLKLANDCDLRELSSQIQDVPRVKLLLIGKNDKQQFLRETFKEVRVKFVVYERGKNVNDAERTLAFGSLITALELGGIGKISRRAFGSMRIRAEKSTFDEQMNRILRILEGETVIESVSNGIKELISTTYKATKSLISTMSKTPKGAILPKIPAISKNPEVFSIFIFKSTDLKKIGDLFMRTNPNSLVNHLRNRYGNIVWIFGLPRNVKGTGYFSEIERRPSPLIFSLLNNQMGVASLMMSADWPTQLEWRGAGGKKTKIEFDSLTGKITLNESIIEISNVIDEIKDYLKQSFNSKEVEVF